ncbi:MAG TPA: IS481 family transposase [Polyangiaceae bacterium]|nr:IS481 family transposase [Polyangiaceae bacterium]
MSLKIEFVERATAKGANIAQLCREYGISRQTGHKWIERFRRQGYDGLEERSRRPHAAPLATAEDVVVEIVRAREAHPSWGPIKLRSLLAAKLGEATPSPRTIARVLDRFGKLRKRRRERGLSIVERAPVVDVKAPNDVWTVDFKGWWRTRDGARCEPLTVRDAFSRFILAIDIVEHGTAAATRVIFERLFRRYGTPSAIQCDNGAPFVSVRARGGLSTLSAWWISLGIRLVRSRPGCPQDNGAHERMHADMSVELEASPEDSLPTQQRACNRWRQQFNHVRPHAALKNKTPADVYKPSPKKPKQRVALYPTGWLVRRVHRGGDIRTASGQYFLSQALAGHRVGLEPVDGLRWRAWFHQVDLGLIEIVPDTLPPTLDRSFAARHRLVG